MGIVRSELDQVSMLTRREIEARLAGPLIKGFIKAMGREGALRVVERVMKDLGRQGGRELAEEMGGNSIPCLAKGHGRYAAGGAYRMKVLRQTDKSYHVDITWCAYAEMYRSLGLADLGLLLSCGRDFAFTQGFNPKIKLTRDKTLMEGDEVCSYRFDLRE
jgi:hypothetical protein